MTAPAPRIHILHPSLSDHVAETMCSRRGYLRKTEAGEFLRTSDLRDYFITTDPTKVTCQICWKRMQ